MPISAEEEEYMLKSQGYVVPGQNLMSNLDKYIQISPRGISFVKSTPNRQSQLFIMLSQMKERIWYFAGDVHMIPGIGNSAESIVMQAKAGKFVEMASKEEIQSGARK